MIATVEFIYDVDCPNVKSTRENLLKAFSKLKLPSKWTEWDTSSIESPDHVKGYGSPTILVNGRDLLGESPNKNTRSCRIYDSSGGDSKGVPSVKLISNALMNKSNGCKKAGLLGGLSIGPGLGAAFLAKASCPLCYPAIGAFLSSIGLGFLFDGPYFLVLMGLFFFVALIGLAFKAKSRRGFGPFWIGLCAVILSLVGRAIANEPIFYGGIVLLVLATVWNLWPKTKVLDCPTCET